MTNDQLLDALYAIGKLPADSDARIDAFPLNEFDELLQQFSTPVTAAEARRLINLSPPTDTGSYGVEWALLHLIETVAIESIQSVVDSSEENELKHLIQLRLDNYNRKANGN